MLSVWKIKIQRNILSRRFIRSWIIGRKFVKIANITNVNTTLEIEGGIFIPKFNMNISVPRDRGAFIIAFLVLNFKKAR